MLFCGRPLRRLEYKDAHLPRQTGPRWQFTPGPTRLGALHLHTSLLKVYVIVLQ